MPDGLGGWAGWIVAVISMIVAGIAQFRKAKVDEGGLAFQMWEGLAKAHTAEIAALTARVTKAEETIARMRKDHADALIEAERRHKREMDSLREENAGLMRMIVQNSHSTAQRMGDPGGTAITKASRTGRGEDK